MQTLAIAYRATHEAIPLFGIYALLFADAGLSTTQISVLLAVWSMSAFLLEVPSGAWADLVDRRALLIASGLVYAAAFATWVAAPTFWGFLVGFVLWAASDAMHSGTWEAYLFDELSGLGLASDYGRVKARAESAALVVMALAIALAAPLHALGGYGLVGVVSVAVALVHVGVALRLPRPLAPARTAAGGGMAAWVHTLRLGVRQAHAVGPVRTVLAGYAVIVALVGIDEYFPLLLAADALSVEAVAVLMAGIVLLEAVGTWLSDAVARLTGWGHAALVLVAGVLLAAGAWFSGPPAAVSLALGYALASSAYVAADVRLQHAIEEGSPARATVTSVAGVVAELGFLLTLAIVGLATLRFDLTPVVGLAALALTVPAAVAAWRMPSG